MASWSNWRSRITASVRTTNRMNALLADSSIEKSKLFSPESRADDADDDQDDDRYTNYSSQPPKRDFQFFRNNFNMERVYKLIEDTIEERLRRDRACRSYDSWRSAQLVSSLASEIRNRVKQLNHRRHRIVCILSLIEKQLQGISNKMKFLMDPMTDNFTKFVYERATYTIVVTLFLVHKD